MFSNVSIPGNANQFTANPQEVAYVNQNKEAAGQAVDRFEPTNH